MDVDATCNVMTGTEDASYARTSGGVEPVGICLITVWETEVIWVWATDVFVPGWKKILTIPRP